MIAFHLPNLNIQRIWDIMPSLNKNTSTRYGLPDGAIIVMISHWGPRFNLTHKLIAWTRYSEITISIKNVCIIKLTALKYNKIISNKWIGYVNYYVNYGKEFWIICYNFCCIVAVCYSSIKHHKLKRRVELKERKRLEILKYHFKFINCLLAMVWKKLMYNFISIWKLHYCIH